MADQERVYRGLSHAAWGYLLLHVDFNINGVSVLPRFAGYLLLLSAIGKLSGERRDLALLRPLAILLAVWNGADWLCGWVGVDPSSLFPVVGLIMAVAVLYFHFQFLTDMAALAEAYQPEEDDLDQRLLRRRSVYVVLSTAADVILYLPAGQYEDERAVAVAALAVAGLVVAVFVMLALFELRRIFREDEEDGETPDV